jgi:hypothetical protein
MQLNLRFGLLAATMVLVTTACNKQSFHQAPVVQALGQKVTYNNQTDILFVIDTKDSMSSVQQGLAAQIPEFILSLNQTGLDYQIAVTTMDMSGSGEQGRFIGSPAIMSASTPDLSTMLRNRLYIGDYDWHPMTRGLETAKNGLVGLNATTGPNAGFTRPNALLVLIFLSNRDDRSSPQGVGDYTAFFDQIRPNLPYGDRSWVAQFMGVLPDDPNCKTAKWGYAEPGVNFINFVKSSGGAVESICDGDMRRALTNVKSRVLEKLTVFPLNAPAAMESIKVTVNGKPVPNDAVNGWTFDEATNTVRFHGTAVPEVSDDIRVDFQRVGLS